MGSACEECKNFKTSIKDVTIRPTASSCICRKAHSYTCDASVYKDLNFIPMKSNCKKYMPLDAR